MCIFQQYLMLIENVFVYYQEITCEFKPDDHIHL